MKKQGGFHRSVHCYSVNFFTVMRDDRFFAAGTKCCRNIFTASLASCPVVATSVTRNRHDLPRDVFSAVFQRVFRGSLQASAAADNGVFLGVVITVVFILFGGFGAKVTAAMSPATSSIA